MLAKSILSDTSVSSSLSLIQQNMPKSQFSLVLPYHTVEYLLCSVVIIVDSPCPVAQMRRKSSFSWGVNFPMTSQVPLANSHRVVSKVVHILRHQLEFRWEAIRCCPVDYVTLQAFFSGNKNGECPIEFYGYLYMTLFGPILPCPSEP